jgi:hypothetical protein
MAFTREAVFLKWGGDVTKRCFMAKIEGYAGGDKDKPASYGRSLYDGSLQRVYGSTTPRRFIGVLLVEDSPSGSYSDGTESINVGSIANLEAAWAATDLKCKSFEDSAYWDAEWEGGWPPTLAYDPKRNRADIPIRLVER